MSQSERIHDILTLLRDGRLSPFDLIQEILDDDTPQFASFRKEFYKEGNEKLEKILDAEKWMVQGGLELLFDMWFSACPEGDP
jgi:hypothetical protein